MRFGFCTGFATGIKDAIDYDLLDMIKGAGYDYAEFPLALIAAISQNEFDCLEGYISRRGLGADACCNMFPPFLRLTGPEADYESAHHYLMNAFPRMRRLGSKTIVFGSSGARNLPKGISFEEGYDQISRFLTAYVIPLLEQYGMTLVMEPIGSYEANFINTLPEGMEVVSRVNHPRVMLLADSVHLLYEHEDPDNIRRYAPYVRHIHICEDKRALPLPEPSDRLKEILRVLVDIGYNGGVSFESMPHSRADIARALLVLKAGLMR